jgi:NADH-quinone oxidoreductase subunit J
VDSALAVWWVMGVAAVASAVGMLASKNPVHSALLLVGNFIAVAVIYLLLSAPLLFAIQLIVYAGAIMVLFLFVIMFFMAPKARQWQRPPLKSQLVLGGVAVVALLLALFIGIGMSGGAPDFAGATSPEQAVALQDLGNPRAVGAWMFTYHVLPFNVIGVLLLAALIAAVMVGRDRVSEGRSHVPEFAPHIDRVVPRKRRQATAHANGNGAPEPVAEEVEA